MNTFVHRRDNAPWPPVLTPECASPAAAATLIVCVENPKPIWALLVALMLLVAAAPARGDVIFDGRWRTPGRDHWDATVFQKPGNRNRLKYVKSPRRRPAGYSADLRVGGNAASERINFVKVPVFADAEGKETWIAWSTWFPRDANLPAPQNQVDLVSFASKFNAGYCDASRGGAATTLFVYNPDPDRRADRWAVKLTGGVAACSIRTHPIAGLGIPRSRWIDFLCHFKWSAIGGRALSTCSWRVQPKRHWTVGFADTGPNNVRSAQFPGNLFIHYGLYKGELSPYVHVVQGGLVVADTRREAERAAFGRGRAKTPPAAAAAAGEPGTTWLIVVIAVAVVALAVLGGRHLAASRRMA